VVGTAGRARRGDAMRQVAPTRSDLQRARRQLDRIERGAALLRRKREALVVELFHLARPAADARQQIDAAAERAWPALLEAMAANGLAGLRAAAWPARDLAVSLRGTQVWGIPVADVLERPKMVRTAAARGLPPGSVGAAATAAAERFERLADLLLEAAPREALIRRLGGALRQTSRQVNTLERRVGPALSRRMGVVRRTLEEREREDQFRLKQLLRQWRRG